MTPLPARALIGFLALCLTPLVIPAEALGEASESLSRVRRLVDAFEFEAAIEELEGVLEAPDVTAAQRIEALELMTVLHFNLGRRERAQQTYERLLAIDPGHEPHDTSYAPRLIAFFDEVKESFLPQVDLEVSATASRAAAEGPTRIRVELSGDRRGVDRVLAMVRLGSGGNFRRALMRPDGEAFVAELPSSPDAALLEYYVEVQAPSGYVLGRAGSEDQPLLTDSAPAGAIEPSEVRVPDDGGGRPERTPVYRSWWLWTIVGAVVVGGAVTAVVLTLPEDQRSGSLGTRSLP